MANFNINNSQVGQMNESGDNNQISGNSAPVSTGDGPINQASGENITIPAATSAKPSALEQLLSSISSVWKWIRGTPS